MSEYDDGGPAFPTVAGHVVYSNGMTLRDWFAGQALGHALSLDYGNDWGKAGSEHVIRACRRAYETADAMLAVRNPTPTKGA